MIRTQTTSAGRHAGLWPVLLILLAAVLVPTGCVLWFMNAAMRSERLAVRQRLMDVYQEQALAAQRRLQAFWSERTAGSDSLAVSSS